MMAGPFRHLPGSWLLPMSDQPTSDPPGIAAIELWFRARASEVGVAHLRNNLFNDCLTGCGTLARASSESDLILTEDFS